MNQIQLFNFKDQPVRTVLIDNEPWFVAKDVTEILELSNPTVVINRLDDDERAKLNLGRQGETNIVNEYGLYQLVLGSRKPEAKEFKRWITHEIIPSIRKTGSYSIYKDERFNIPTNLIDALRLSADLEEERQALQVQIETDAPYTSFGKIVSYSSSAVSIGEFCKIVYDKHGISIGRNKMFDWLRNRGYLIKHGRERNNPKQQYVEQGLFVSKPAIISRSIGNVQEATTLITGKGQVKISDQLLKEFQISLA